MFDAHGKNVALDITLHDIPGTLVDDERCFTCHASVRIRFGNNPGRGIGHAEVENLALHNEIV